MFNRYQCFMYVTISPVLNYDVLCCTLMDVDCNVQINNAEMVVNERL